MQYVFSVGGVWCHASGMQFVTLQGCNLSLSGMQFVTLRNAPKSCINIRKFIVLSAVAALAVSLSTRQMAKVVMHGSEERAI